MNAAPRYRRDYRSARGAPLQKKMGATFTPRPLTDREAAKRFRSTVINFSAGQLAIAAQRSKDTAKSWKAGRACPNAASLINMARALPTVAAWLAHEIERGEEFESDRTQTMLRQMIALELDKRGQ